MPSSEEKVQCSAVQNCLQLQDWSVWLARNKQKQLASWAPADFSLGLLCLWKFRRHGPLKNITFPKTTRHYRPEVTVTAVRTSNPACLRGVMYFCYTTVKTQSWKHMFSAYNTINSKISKVHFLNIQSCFNRQRFVNFYSPPNR